MVGAGRNAYGQLGLGDWETRTTFSTARELDGIVDVAADTDHGLALTGNGEVWNWGLLSEFKAVTTLADVFTIPYQPAGLFNVRAIAGGTRVPSGPEE